MEGTASVPTKARPGQMGSLRCLEGAGFGVWEGEVPYEWRGLRGGPEAAAINDFGQREGMGDMADVSFDCFSGNMDLGSSAPGGLRWVAQAQELPQERGQGSPQKACPRRALHGVLLLCRARLSQRQRAE